MYQLSTWQRFWRLEVPHAVPNLVWNMMMSVSGGWFFVVASEAITVVEPDDPAAGHRLLYRDGDRRARSRRDRLRRRWSCWSSSCSTTSCCSGRCWHGRASSAATSRRRGRRPPVVSDRAAARAAVRPGAVLGVRALNRAIDDALRALSREHCRPGGVGDRVVAALRAAVRSRAAGAGGRRRRCGSSLFIGASVPAAEIGWVFVLGLITALRVFVLIALASLSGCRSGCGSGCARASPTGRSRSCSFSPRFRPICSFRPAVVLILRFRLNPEIWLSPLMILGTQWYILFNVIAGTHRAVRASCSSPRQPRGARLAVVAAGHAAGDLSGLCHRRGHRRRRVVERQHRLRSRAMGRHDLARDRDRRLHRPLHGSRRRRPHLARHRACCAFMCWCFNRLLWHRLYDIAAERLRLE